MPFHSPGQPTIASDAHRPASQGTLSREQAPTQTALRSTDQDVLLPRRSSKTAVDKRSYEYLIKSGVAGGFAGCAVSRSLLIFS